MPSRTNPRCAIGDSEAFMGTVRCQEVNTMLKDMTRSKLIGIWFAAVALAIVGCIALGVAVTIGTGALLLAMSLVPPLLVVMLWPNGGAPTVAEVLHDAQERP
jgi:hypothetical protein